MDQASGAATLERQLLQLRQDFAASEARFFQVFQLAPIAMSISTLDGGRYLEVNSTLLETTGYSREEVVGKTARELRVYSDPNDFARVRDILDREGMVRGLEMRLCGKNDEIRTVLLSGEIIDFAGERCLLTASIDISERKVIEAELADSESRYRAAVITARMAAWETDMVTCTRTWTKEGMELFGLSLPGGRGHVLGSNDEFYNALHPDDRHMMKQFHRTADVEDTYPCEYRIVRPDGTVLWVSGRGRVVARGPDGKAQRVANIVVDVTARKKAEEHAQMLMGEISHRSKNLLAIVQAIARQTARSVGSLDDFERKFALRLQGLASSNELLLRNDWRGVSLTELAREQLMPFAEIGPRLAVEGPDVLIAAASAQTIGLALHELATNATKYGAWSTNAGAVVLNWAYIDDALNRRLRLRWIESGGPTVSTPSRKGFGHVVFEDMVVHSAQGQVCISFEPSGLRWELSLPTANVVEGPKLD